MTVLFSDLRNFTTHAHALTPETLVALLNDHMTEMTAIVFRHDGVLAHYAGDGLEAFWNAPMTQPDHARRACVAALEMIAALGAPPARVRGARLGAARHGRGDQHRQHDRRGPASRDRLAYTAVGDPLNVASRIEGLSKEYGVHVVIGEGYPTGGRRRLRVPLPRPGGREGTRRAPPGLRAARARRRRPAGPARGRSRGTTTASRSIAIDGGPRPRRSSTSSPPRRPGTAPWPLYRQRARALLEDPPAPRLGRRVDREDEVAATGSPRRPLRAGDSSTNPGGGPSPARGGETLPKNFLRLIGPDGVAARRTPGSARRRGAARGRWFRSTLASGPSDH